MSVVIIPNNVKAQEKKSVIISIVSLSIYHEVMGPDTIILVFWMLSFKSALSHSFHLHQEAILFLFAFCHKGAIICISEVIDISPSNLESSLCFIQPGILQDVLCI